MDRHEEDDDRPTRAATFLESRALFLHQSAIELHERLERLAIELEEARTQRIPPKGAVPGELQTAMGEAETARVTAARAKMMSHVFRQWVEDGSDPLQHAHDMVVWQRVKDAARSLGLSVA